MKLTKVEQVLSDLVEIPSVTENREANDRALDYIGAYLTGLGMFVERRSYLESPGGRPPQEYGTLVATTRPTKTPLVMISAHVDVVPGPKKLFRLRLTEGSDRLEGRGTGDMKDSIAAALVVASDLKRRFGSLSEFDFGITAVTNEEIGGRGVENLLKDGFVPQGVVLLPDNGQNWQIERVAKGAWTIVITAGGTAAHGSRPWDGDSASFRILNVLDEVRALFEAPSISADTLNISRIRVGEAQNQVPAKGTATLDIRVMSEESRNQLEQKIDEICRRHGANWELLAFFPAIERDMSDPYIQAYLDSVKEVNGIVCQESISPSSCDAVYYDQWGIPTIVSKPDCGGEHGDSEWTSKKGLAQFVQVLTRFLMKTCRVK